MENLFNKINLQKITEEIADQLRALITEGKISPGEKLPPERTLAEMLGVGRSSLREALNILQTQGFVETRKRKGVFVCSIGAAIVADPLQQVLKGDKHKLLQLYEIRKDLEIATVAKAAELRTSEDVKILELLLNSMEKDSKQTRLELEKDVAFHLAIAQSTGNLFRSHILKSILDLCDVYLQYVVRHIVNDNQQILTVLDQHAQIFKAIEQRDPGLAQQAMKKHLTFVENQWKAYVIS